MRRISWVLIAALIFTGCSYFIPARKLEDCEALVKDYQKAAIQSNAAMSSALNVIDSLQYDNEILKHELEKCQKKKAE